MALLVSISGAPISAPRHKNTPRTRPDEDPSKCAAIVGGTVDRHDHRVDADDYSQAGGLYCILSDDQKQQLVNNIAGALGGASKEVQERMLSHFDQCDPAYGQSVRDAMK